MVRGRRSHAGHARGGDVGLFVGIANAGDGQDGSGRETHLDGQVCWLRDGVEKGKQRFE